MSRSSSLPRGRHALVLKLGDWFEAQATGLGVLAVPVVLAIFTALVVARLLLR